MNDKLKFGNGNAKLSKAIGTFSLPAGWTCPFAKDCLTKSNRITGKMMDGKNCKFRCFSATSEFRATSVRNARWHNFDLLRKSNSVKKMAELIQKSLPKGINTFRVNVSGDFYNEKYFLAWLNVAYNNPLMVFYGYTKALPFLVKYKKYIPGNFRFTASKGGTHDYLINKHKLKYAEVVFSVEEAENKNLEIDHDDSHAYNAVNSFALLLHGPQPENSAASKALSNLKKQGIMGYNKKRKNRIAIPEKSFIMYIQSNNGKIEMNHKIKYIPRKNYVKR